ncbi:DUF6531 domain-containing protein, partial [Schaalia canis]
MKLSDANLDDLQGMPDVDFDFGVSSALVAAFRAAASKLEGQQGSRVLFRRNAGEGFEGFYAQRFLVNGTTQMSDCGEIVSHLRLAASKVERLEELAREENNRRRLAREWAQRRAERNALQAFIEDHILWSEPPPFSSIDTAGRGPSESVPAPAAGMREVPQQGSGAGGTSSAVPDKLRSFSSSTRGADQELSWVPGNLESHCSSFASACRWASLDASSVISGLRRWLADNESEAKWIDVVADAFERAGSAGELSTLPNEALAAAMAAAGVSDTREDIVITPAVAFGSPPTTGYCDDPINAATGNFLENEEDLSFSGVAASLSLRRSYSSMNTSVGAFGRGWSSWCDARLVLTEEAAELTVFDGRLILFPRFGRGWERARGENLWCEALDAGGYVVSSAWGLRWVFDARGVLVSASEGAGTCIEFERFSDGRISSVRHEYGRRVTLSWDDAGDRVIRAESSDGRVVDYSYDHAGRLVGVHAGAGARRYEWNDEDLISAVIDADGVVEARNTYDEHARVVTQCSSFGRTTHLTYLPGGVTVSADADGSRHNTWIHDRKGRLIGLVDADGRRQSTSYDGSGNPVVVTRRDGQSTVFLYDERGRKTLQQEPSGARTVWEYDECDRVVCVRRAPSAHATEDECAITRMEYEGEGRHPWRIVDAEGGVSVLEWEGPLLRRITDPVGVSVSFAYNSFGELVASTDGAGNTARLERDEAGRVVAAVTPLGNVTRYHYHPDSGVLFSRVDPTGARWCYEYSAGGRLAATIDPYGGRLEHEYGDHGEVIATRDPLGRTVTHLYDDLGNFAGVELPDGSTWEFGYDALSRLTHMSDLGGGQWQMGYDGDGFLASTVDATGVTRRVERNTWGQPTRVDDGDNPLHARYDALGQMVAVAGADGAESIVRYDRCGRMVEQIDAEGGVYLYERDAAGRLVAVTQPTGATYRYEYDQCGRWVATISTGGNRYEMIYDADSQIVGEIWPTGERVETTFDAAGRITSRREPGRGTVRFTYDKLGRMTRTSDPWNGKRTFTYDAAGQVLAVTNALGGVTRFEYDDLGHIHSVIDPLGKRTKRRYDPMGRLVSSIDALGRETTFTYDEAGRPTSTTMPTGHVTRWEYTPGGLPSRTLVDNELVVEVERDYANRQLSMTDASGTTVSWQWDKRGLLLQRLRGGVGVSYTYDEAGRRTTMRTPDGSVTTYSYDANNDINAITHPSVGHVTISRDTLGRITGVDAKGLHASWQWGQGGVVAHEVNRHGFIQRTRLERDESGRVVAEVRDGLRVSYEYDAAGQLLATRTNEGLETTYTWDEAGRLASEATNGALTRYFYDDAGQLTTALTPSGQRITYTYDEAGRRVREQANGWERRFTWDPRGYLAHITTLTHQGDHPLVAREWCEVDAGGELATANGQTMYWDSAALLPTLAQVGQRVLTNALNALALPEHDEGQGEARWLVPDMDGRGVFTALTTAGAGEGAQAQVGQGANAWGVHAATDGAHLDPHTHTHSGADAWSHTTNTLLAPTHTPTTGKDTVGALTLTGSGGISLGGMEWMTQRTYDPHTRSFLSPDPLPAVLGAAWAANPYSYAGNDPVGASDPLGLRPVSEADLRAYQQASTSTLSAGVAAAGSWLKDNWEYIAAGAVIVAGVAVMCTGVGGPLGAAMIGGALMAAGGSIGSQKYTTGTVNWGQVAKDGLIGGATGIIGGGAAMAAGRMTAGMTSCLGRNILVGGVEGMTDGAASNGLNYLTSGQPITLNGLAHAVGGGAFEGGAFGAGGGALTKVTGVARFGCFTADTPVVMADGTTTPISQVQAGDEI